MFNECTSLASITIPDSVTSIGVGAFGGCSSLTSITVDTNNPNYASEGGILYNKTKTTLLAYPSANGSVTIAEGVTEIDSDAFRGCTSLTSITIPDSVTSSINYYMFEDCTGLTSITVDVNNPNYSSQDGILYNKAKTSFVYIPRSISGAVTIPDSVTYIDGFQDCTSLTSVTIAAGSIQPSAFSGCTSLISVTIAEGVTSIEALAFSGCISLTSVTIPASVTSIQSAAFSNCTSLATITCLRTTPPSLSSYYYGEVFSNTHENLVIKVPSASVTAYQTASGWSSYASMISAIQ